MTVQPSKTTWTPALDGVLTTFVRTGADLDHIARVCGVSRAAVEARLGAIGGIDTPVEPTVHRDEDGTVLWTQALDKRLREFAEDGMTAIDISRILGISQTSVATRMSRIDARPSLTWNQIDRIMELHDEGTSPRLIAIRVGLSERYVRRLIAENENRPRRKLKPVKQPRNTPKTKTSWTPEQDDELRKLVADGVRVTEIAVRLDRPQSTVSSRRLLLGVRYDHEKLDKDKMPTASPQTMAALRDIAARHSVGLKALVSSMDRTSCAARADAYRYLRELGWSYIKIGDFFGRDSSTIHNIINGKNPNAWTEYDDNRLREMCERGFSAQEIGDALGRTRVAIDLRKHRLGVKQTRAADKIVEEIIRRYEAGESTPKIAKSMKVNRGTVEYHVRVAGAVNADTKIIAIQRPHDVEMVQLAKDGLTPSQIARRLGLLRSSVKSRLVTLARHEAVLEAAGD